MSQYQPSKWAGWYRLKKPARLSFAPDPRYRLVLSRLTWATTPTLLPTPLSDTANSLNALLQLKRMHDGRSVSNEN